jgi:hypothetical protein
MRFGFTTTGMADPVSGIVRKNEIHLDDDTLAAHGRMLIVPINEYARQASAYIDCPLSGRAVFAKQNTRLVNRAGACFAFLY